MNKPFRGICAVAVTPFKSNGDFDIDAAKENLDYLYECGVQGVCLLGATGEYMSVTNEEHKDYIRQIVPYVSGRMTVVAGATRERPDDVIDLINNAQTAGAHAAMVLPPYYCHPAQEEILAHYRYITERIKLPLMVYNNPGSAKVDITPDTMKQIFALMNIGLVKESTGDIRRLTQTRLDVPPHVSVLCGCDNLAYESFVAGADGWVSMLANIAPRDCVALYDSICVEKDFKKGFGIYQRMLPALNVLEGFPKPVQALKYLLSRKGKTGGCVRRPRMELTQEEKAYVLTSMKADGLQ